MGFFLNKKLKISAYLAFFSRFRLLFFVGFLSLVVVPTSRLLLRWWCCLTTGLFVLVDDLMWILLTSFSFRAMLSEFDREVKNRWACECEDEEADENEADVCAAAGIIILSTSIVSIWSGLKLVLVLVLALVSFDDDGTVWSGWSFRVDESCWQSSACVGDVFVMVVATTAVIDFFVDIDEPVDVVCVLLDVDVEMEDKPPTPPTPTPEFANSAMIWSGGIWFGLYLIVWNDTFLGFF